MAPGSLTDAELLVASLSDPDAFDAFYRRHAQGVYGWFRLHATSDEQALLDLTAETFAQALLNLDRFRGRTADAGAGWLFGIARNLARQHHRRGRVEMRAAQRLGLPHRVLEEHDFGSADPRLRDALDRLPAAQRRAVELRVVEDFSYERIAAELACSEQSARLRVSRGLKKLRARLDPEEAV